MMRLNMDYQKHEEIIKSVQEFLDADEGTIDDFIDGGDEGWDCGDDEQQEWLDSADANEISDWVIAGLR